jgi:hypothetical protein
MQDNIRCTKCEEEAAKHERAKIEEVIKKALEEAPARGISGTSVVILQRANGTNYFWTTETDERVGRLKIVERVWID